VHKWIFDKGIWGEIMPVKRAFFGFDYMLPVKTTFSVHPICRNFSKVPLKNIFICLAGPSEGHWLISSDLLQKLKEKDFLQGKHMNNSINDHGEKLAKETLANRNRTQWTHVLLKDVITFFLPLVLFFLFFLYLKGGCGSDNNSHSQIDLIGL